MANRRFEMYQYRHILSHMRSGDSDRDLARAGVIGRRKAGELRRLAGSRGWLDPGRPLPDEAELAAAFEVTPKQTVPSWGSDHQAVKNAIRLRAYPVATPQFPNPDRSWSKSCRWCPL